MMPVLFEIPWLGWPVRGYGLMLMIGFLGGVYLAARRAQRVGADPDLVLNTGFVALIFGILGARVFYVIHYWQRDFADRPNPVWAALDITRGGLEFYGSVLGGVTAVLVYFLIKRVSIRWYLDIVAPSLMFGLMCGRIGCFLNGCCWGATCVDAQGQATVPWAVRFPFGSGAHWSQWQSGDLALPPELIYVDKNRGFSQPLSRENLARSEEEILAGQRELDAAQAALAAARQRGADEEEIARLERRVQRAERRVQRDRLRYIDVATNAGLLGHVSPFADPPTLEELRALAAQYPSLPVHPTQLYASISALIIWIMSELYFSRRRRHGTVLLLVLSVYAVTRFVEELIRVDNPHDTFGLTISQFISLGILAVCAVWGLILLRMAPRSPRAVPASGAA